MRPHEILKSLLSLSLFQNFQICGADNRFSRAENQYGGMENSFGTVASRFIVLLPKRYQFKICG
jgi:hypothetical protein